MFNTIFQSNSKSKPKPIKDTSHHEQVSQVYTAIEEMLREAEIDLVVTRKKVKNINFRIKPNLLSVSAPFYASDKEIISALAKRIDWAIHQHASLLKRQRLKQLKESTPAPIKLWGEPQGLVMGEQELIRWYRHELNSVMPNLFAKWQPIVGAEANEMRIKKMKTRWGSCNTRVKRVWLSVYLPAYPIECTEYVIVHELCHLHQANHSPAFWREVERSMPDYKRWHNMLAGKSGEVD